MNETSQDPAHPEETSGLTGGKRVAFLSSLAMIGAVLGPIQQNWRAQPHDSFPLSYYPMFSAKRQAIETFHYLVGGDAEVFLPPASGLHFLGHIFLRPA